jgi:serine/threonine protein kinase
MEFDHPNVIKAFEVFEDENCFYIVMEHPNNGDLFSYLCKKSKLTLTEASKIFFQIVNAIDYIHSNRVVHRDMKPENFMLTEDMIQDELNISKDNDVMKTRLPLFNASYFSSGIDKYLEGDDAAYSYSSIYAFGAFLARNYGGPSFIQAMSKNKTVGWNSIISAIKSNTGEEVTRLQLFEEFIAACSVHSEFAEYTGIKRFYLDSKDNITVNSVTLLNDSIDLWDELYSYQVSYTSPIYRGPLILSKDVGCDLPPHTFVIHSAGKAIGDTITLDFSKRKSSKEKIMIIIQDSYSNTL